MLVTTWDSELTTEETNELCQSLAQVHSSKIQEEAIRKHIPRIDSDTFLDCASLSLPYADASLIAVFDSTSGKVHSLAQDLYHLGQISAFFKKRADLDLGIDREQAALETFLASEASCREVNECFRAWSRGGFQFPPSVEAVLHQASRKISRVLGDKPSFTDLRPRFGPGATTQLPKRMACAKVKLSQPLACSRDMVSVLADALETLPHLTPDGDGEKVTVPVEIHRGNLVTVPKSFKTDRTVLIEPSLNMMFQLAVGDVIRDGLKKVGVDLRDQARNKSLARASSMTGALATLDLSSASDSIAVELVRHLVPPDWYDLLSSLRTSQCEMKDGVIIDLEKFSSMGNGFTFPLESLVFWAVVSSISGERNVSVYGDDLIIPVKDVEKTITVLRTLGFSVNKEKSFWEGLFRESCGGDYFFGFDVRPHFVKGRLTGEGLFSLHNHYVARGEVELAERVRQYIDGSIQLFGPSGYGDGHLHTCPYLDYPGNGATGLYRSKNHRKDQWCGSLFDTFRWVGRKYGRPLPGDRILPSYSIYVREDTGEGEYDPVASLEKLALSKLALYYAKIPSAQNYGAGDKIVESIPGKKGYKRISIYTLG